MTNVVIGVRRQVDDHPEYLLGGTVPQFDPQALDLFFTPAIVALPVNAGQIDDEPGRAGKQKTGEGGRLIAVQADLQGFAGNGTVHVEQMDGLLLRYLFRGGVPGAEYGRRRQQGKAEADRLGKGMSQYAQG